METAEKNRIIKKALVKEYKDIAKVRVIGSTGTAYGWVEIYIDFIDKNNKDDIYTNKATDIAREALKKVGEKFNIYCSDDGYNYDNKCVMVNIS